MTYRLIFSDKSVKQLEKLEKTTYERIISKLEQIQIRPFKYVKKLVGNPHFSLRVGDYRVILRITSKELVVFVVELAHRKKVYKR